MYVNIGLSNAPQPPLNLRGGEGELCEFDRLLMYLFVYD